MSSEVTKPVVTKAGHGEIKPEEAKKGFFSRRKKQKIPSPGVGKRLGATKELPKARRASPSAKKSKSHKKKLTRQRPKRTDNKYRKSRPLGGKVVFTSVVVLLLGVIGFSIISRGNNRSVGITLSDKTETSLLGEQTQATVVGIGIKPDFKVLVIKNLPIDQQQYDAEIGAFFFQDRLAGAIIRVNEQQLPPELAMGSNAVKNLALSKEGVSSISQLETKKGPVYLGNLDSGGQVAIFDFDNLLLFIQSTSTIAPEAWVEYINELSY